MERSAPWSSGFAQSGPRKVLSIAITGLPSPNWASRGGGARLAVDKSVGRVGRAFEIDERHPAHRLGAGEHRLDLGALGAGREIEPLDSEAAEDARDKGL